MVHPIQPKYSNVSKYVLGDVFLMNDFYLLPPPWSSRLLLPLSRSALSNIHHPGAPHPDHDVPLVEPAAVAPVPLRVDGGVSNTQIVLEAVWESYNNGIMGDHCR
jgi:hypothetical protein